MRFVSVRELRERSASIWKALADEKDLVITSNGKSIALLSATSGESLEESLGALRARAQAAASAMQRAAQKTASDRLSLHDINAEISAARAERPDEDRRKPIGLDPETQRPMTPPHIVYVLDDQHRYCALGSSGNPIVRTPNLDRLAGEGMVLDQVFSSCPICAPHRAQLFTGRYSHCNGVPDNEYRLRAGQTTLPQALKRAGYHTGLIGKWHLGYPPYSEEQRFGFDYMAANNAEHDYYRGSYFENERGPISSTDGHRRKRPPWRSVFSRPTGEPGPIARCSWS